MMGLGAGEWVVIVVIALLMFGGSRLPALGRNLGAGIRNFRDALRHDGPKDDHLPPR